ncbi:hypothetical protein K2173_009120 [Erythroxylum novogranatense]|uniref:MADS-box domain-containing protein n=1 Tax=Erythroxylum novogranatense TaxID=1862640 RepID=A0AAV8TEY5_9ROSI|nr:hypothetical protein K2173_009120 [Erythroxylum novogranatense]
MASPVLKRKSIGRQKVEMEKMMKNSNLQVTYSKRRSGLFKKASELCTLCGAEIVIIVFSPGKKVFSFGHPGVKTLVDRYLSRSTPPLSATMQLIEAHRNASVRQLNMQLTQVLQQLEMEKKHGEELSQMRKASQSECWWDAPIDALNIPQLEQLTVALEELKKNVAKEADNLLIQHSNNTPNPMHHQQQPFGSATVGMIHFDQNPTLLNDFNPNMMMPHGHGSCNLGYGHGFY